MGLGCSVFKLDCLTLTHRETTATERKMQLKHKTDQHFTLSFPVWYAYLSVHAVEVLLAESVKGHAFRHAELPFPLGGSGLLVVLTGPCRLCWPTVGSSPDVHGDKLSSTEADQLAKKTMRPDGDICWILSTEALTLVAPRVYLTDLFNILSLVSPFLWNMTLFS